MNNEEIAMQLIGLYAMACIKNATTPDHKRAVANAILKLGYQWDGQIGVGNDL